MMKIFENSENRKLPVLEISKYFTNESRFHENNTDSTKIIQWRRKVNKPSSYKTIISNKDHLMTWHRKSKQIKLKQKLQFVG